MKTTDTKGTAIRGVIASGSCKPSCAEQIVFRHAFSFLYHFYFFFGNYSCVVIDQGLKWDLADLE